MCHKVSYRSKAKAQQAMITLKGLHHKPYRAYKCKMCDTWHLITQLKKFTPEKNSFWLIPLTLIFLFISGCKPATPCETWAEHWCHYMDRCTTYPYDPCYERLLDRTCDKRKSGVP
jgi:hypothetical protein